jgi:hypothetical protein
VNRRTFIANLGLGPLGAPFAAGAQQARQVHRMGILGDVPLTNAEGPILWNPNTGSQSQLQVVEANQPKDIAELVVNLKTANARSASRSRRRSFSGRTR